LKENYQDSKILRNGKKLPKPSPTEKKESKNFPGGVPSITTLFRGLISSPVVRTTRIRVPIIGISIPIVVIIFRVIRKIIEILGMSSDL
jgi:hypothetical protein